MKKILLGLVITLVWSLGLMSSETKAQSCPNPAGCIYGNATVTINYSASRVEGYSYAQADYTAGLNFNPRIEGAIYRTDFPETDLDFRTSTGNGSSVAAVINLSTTNFVSGKTYCNYTNYFTVRRSTGQISYIGFIQDCKTIISSPTPTPTPPCTPLADGSLPPCPTPTPTATPSPSPTVTISMIDVVEKHGEKVIMVSVANNATGTTKFTIRITNGTGNATFENGSMEFIVNGNATNQELKIKGVTESSQADNITIEATFNTSTMISAHDEFTVAVITSLVFEKINNDDERFDNNPGTDGVVNPDGSEGLRIFPDKNGVNDTTDRSIIKVEANVSPSVPNVKVYFASFDLDDPSTSAVIDTNGIAGNDNNGNGLVPDSKSGEFLAAMGTNCTSVTTVSNISKIGCEIVGESASTNYKVTMQPGDNFAVAASFSDTYRDGITLNTQDGSILNNSANQAIPLSGATNPDNVAGLRTGMLTAWRRLHIEVDSMGVAQENYVRGNVLGASTINRGRSRTLNVVAPDLELNRFENGRMELAYITNFLDVISNTANTVTVRNQTANNIVIANNVNFWISNLDVTGTPLGTIPTGQTIASMQTVTLNVTTCTPLSVNAFSDGQIYITPTLRSLTVTSNTINTVDVTNNTTAPIVIADATFFRLYDDDDMDHDVTVNPNGDECEDVLPPNPADFNYLTNMSDNPANNYFAPAYIRPMFDLAGSGDNITFIANVNRFNLINTISDSFNNIETEAQTDFWTIHLLTGYQYESGETINGVVTINFDADPYNLMGNIPRDAAYAATDVLNDAVHTPIPGGQGAILFMEMSRANEYPRDYSNRPVSKAHTIVHEIGHLFSCGHGESGLMEITQSRTVGTFSETSLFWIRKTINP